MSGTGAAAEQVPATADDRWRGQMVRLLAVRLAVALGVLGVAAALQGSGRGVAPEAMGTFYALLAFSFLATATSAALLGWVRHPGPFGAAQVAIDLAIVTALVVVTGRSESSFAIGYALITIYAALLFESRGAMAAAAASAVVYAAALFGPVGGWLPAYGPAAADVDVLMAVWGVHCGGLLLVAFLASTLSREIERAGAALDRSASDLQDLRRLHQRTVESLTSGVLTTDVGGRLTSFNPEAERITGRARSEVMGLDLEAVLPGARAAALEGEGVRSRARIAFTNRAGEARFLGVAGSALREDGADGSGHVLIFQDVTAVVAMEGELRRSERLAAVGQMAADMAHELRNPLAAVSGSIQMLETALREAGRDPEHQRLVEIVHRETERLDGLLGDFLQFARPAPARRQAVPLHPLVEEAVELFVTSQQPALDVSIEVAASLCVDVDPGQLRQVLWNLLLNAAQSMPDGGALDIVAVVESPAAPQENAGADRNPEKPEGGELVEITVRDGGVGIAPDDLERIFDPFYTTKTDGSGLGLATVLRIVEGHGGTLRIESRLGEGTAVRVRLPAAVSPS